MDWLFNIFQRCYRRIRSMREDPDEQIFYDYPIRLPPNENMFTRFEENDIRYCVNCLSRKAIQGHHICDKCCDDTDQQMNHVIKNGLFY